MEWTWVDIDLLGTIKSSNQKNKFNNNLSI